MFPALLVGTAVAATDPAGQEVHLNPAAALVFGVPVGENVAPHTPAGSRLRRALFGQDQWVASDDSIRGGR